MSVCSSRFVIGSLNSFISRSDIYINWYKNWKQEEHPIVNQHCTQCFLCPEQLGRRTVRIDAELFSYLLVGKTF